jgi:hypothetical protein
MPLLLGQPQLPFLEALQLIAKTAKVTNKINRILLKVFINNIDIF